MANPNEVDKAKDLLTVIGAPEHVLERTWEIAHLLGEKPAMVNSILSLAERMKVQTTYLNIWFDKEEQGTVSSVKIFLNWIELPGMAIDKNNEIPLPFAWKYEIRIEKYNQDGSLMKVDTENLIVNEGMEVVWVDSLQ